MNEFGKHQDSKSQEMQALKRIGQAFIITSQTAKTGQPPERALHHPAPRQQDKTTLGLGQLDDHQLNSLFSRRALRLAAGIALVNKSHLDALLRYFLDELRQFRHLRTILFVGWRD